MYGSPVARYWASIAVPSAEPASFGQGGTKTEEKCPRSRHADVPVAVQPAPAADVERDARRHLLPRGVGEDAEEALREQRRRVLGLLCLEAGVVQGRLAQLCLQPGGAPWCRGEVLDGLDDAWVGLVRVAERGQRHQLSGVLDPRRRHVRKARVGERIQKGVPGAGLSQDRDLARDLVALVEQVEVAQHALPDEHRPLARVVPGRHADRRHDVGLLVRGREEGHLLAQRPDRA